jgi:hypothetical protein
MCLSTARNCFRCIRSSRSEPWLLKKSLSTLRSYRRREPPLCGSLPALLQATEGAGNEALPARKPPTYAFFV